MAEQTTVIRWIIQARGLPDGPHRGETAWRHDGGPGSNSREAAEEIADLYTRRLGGREYRVAKRTIVTTDEDPS